MLVEVEYTSNDNKSALLLEDKSTKKIVFDNEKIFNIALFSNNRYEVEKSLLEKSQAMRESHEDGIFFKIIRTQNELRELYEMINALLLSNDRVFDSLKNIIVITCDIIDNYTMLKYLKLAAKASIHTVTLFNKDTVNSQCDFIKDTLQGYNSPFVFQFRIDVDSQSDKEYTCEVFLEE